MGVGRLAMSEHVYLIQFYYDAYNQGLEERCKTVLVYAASFEVACSKIRPKFQNARDFRNLTIF